MDITSSLIKKYKWQNRLFYLLFSVVIVLAAMVSNKYQFISDWTANNQNSLNEKTIALLQLLEEPIIVRSYTADRQIKKVVKRLLERYQQKLPSIELEFIDPAQHPQQIRELGVKVEGELIIEMGGRIEHLTRLNESKLTNAIFRLARKSKRKIVFIEGHGERRAVGKANFDYGEFSQQLQKQGFEIVTNNLSQSMQMDSNNDVLVIAGPQSDFLNGEVQILLEYLERGVNLLWLLDPIKEGHQGQYLFALQPLAERLGLEIGEGVVVDTTTKRLQLERPDYAIITDYIQHPLTADMQGLTIFPQAVTLDPTLEGDEKNLNRFSFDPFLLTIEQSWLETSEVTGTIHFDADEDSLGPLIIGITQSRELTEQTALDEDSPTVRKQRVVVIGDGDFISNAFVANGGNLSLGLNIFNWLSQDDKFVAIPAKEQQDSELDLSERQLMIIGFSFFMLLPVLLVLAGLMIRFKRRRREVSM